ncbi:MAG: tRNA1Val (adenine37-N6)-methyltransferase [Oleispira sp.]|jgi:tRNA1Val (adenine37-N6)-methyltransferase
MFKLQKFSVKQSISGMKICSDSLLFGASISVEGAKRVLDIGTGTGILSLMLAQKSLASKDSTLTIITAIELTREAAEEAQENFNNSPWTNQLEIIQQDIQQFSRHQLSRQKGAQMSAGYDVIVCNPPFFVNQTKTSAENPLRYTARHSDTLSFADLCQSIDRLLTKRGSAYLLLPTMAITEFCDEATMVGLKLIARTDIAESAEHLVKVSIMQFHRNKAQSEIKIKQSRLNKFKQANVHSDEVRDLLSPFLLRYL